MPTVTTKVNANVDELWRYLTVPELMSTWMPGVESLRTADGSVLAEGSSLLFEARGKTHESRVKALQPRELLVLESTQGPITATYFYHLKEDAEGVWLELSVGCEARGFLKLVAPVIGRLIWMSDKSQPEKLKAALASA